MVCTTPIHTNKHTLAKAKGAKVAATLAKVACNFLLTQS